MELTFREMRTSDIEDMFLVRSRTRQNPISKEHLASFGITPASTIANLSSGRVNGWACVHNSVLVGFCNSDGTTGEILVLAVLAEYEGKGIGTKLLSNAVDWLLSIGVKDPWLAASSDPDIRAHGFYRALGWRPTGASLENGDQILRLELRDVP
jgi:GNAT superfamily N-acetyltransferase